MSAEKQALLALTTFTIPATIFANTVGIELSLAYFLEEVIGVGYAEAVEGSGNIIDMLGLHESRILKPFGNTVVKCVRVNLYTFTAIM